MHLYAKHLSSVQLNIEKLSPAKACISHFGWTFVFETDIYGTIFINVILSVAFAVSVVLVNNSGYIFFFKKCSFFGK